MYKWRNDTKPIGGTYGTKREHSPPPDLLATGSSSYHSQCLSPCRVCLLPGGFRASSTSSSLVFGSVIILLRTQDTSFGRRKTSLSCAALGGIGWENALPKALRRKGFAGPKVLRNALSLASSKSASVGGIGNGSVATPSKNMSPFTNLRREGLGARYMVAAVGFKRVFRGCLPNVLSSLPKGGPPEQGNPNTTALTMSMRWL